MSDKPKGRAVLTVEELTAAINEGAKHLDSRGRTKRAPMLPLIGTAEFIAEGLGIKLFYVDAADAMEAECEKER